MSGHRWSAWCVACGGLMIIHQEQPREIGVNRHHLLAYSLCDSFNRVFGGTPSLTLWEPEEPVQRE